jgi:hypothetical protein
VQRKAQTKKLVKNQAMREKAPTTEERPVFQVEGVSVEKPAAAEAEPISKLLIVAIAAGVLAVILGAILILK